MFYEIALIAREMNVACLILITFTLKLLSCTKCFLQSAQGCLQTVQTSRAVDAVCRGSQAAGAARMKEARRILALHPNPHMRSSQPGDGTGREGRGCCRAGLVTSCRGVWPVPPPGPRSHAVPWEVRRLSQSQRGVLQGWGAGTACSRLLPRLVVQAVRTPQPNPSGWCRGKNTLGSWSFVSLQSELLLFNTFPMNSYELTRLLDFPLI